MYLESNNGRSHVAGLHESTRVTTSSQADKPRLLNLDLIYELGWVYTRARRNSLINTHHFIQLGMIELPSSLPPSLVL